MQTVADVRSLAKAHPRSKFIVEHPEPVLLLQAVVVGDLADQRGAGGRTKVLVNDPGTIHKRLFADLDESRRRLPTERFLAVREQSYPKRGYVTVGRTSGADLVVNDYTISAEHARIHMIPGISQAFIEDRGSTNGTWVDGVRLEPGTNTMLASGAEVQMGRMVMFFLNAADFHRYLTDAFGGQ